MFNTEISPLINKTKSTNSKYRVIGCILVLALLAIAFLFYSQSSFPKSSDKLLINGNAQKWHPTQSEIDDYRSKVVVIEYDMADLPGSGGILSDIIMNDDVAMNSFHDDLITKHGYNSDDYNVHFAVMDPDDTDLTDDAIMGLRCGSMYTMSLEEGIIELNCANTFRSPKMKIVGCVSYEHDTNGVRWGETGSDQIDCYTKATDTGLTLLSGRCCKARGKAELTTSATSAWAEQANGFCFGTECKEGDTAMGCGATTGTDKIAELSGAKRTQDDRTGATGCKAQRSTSGYLSIAPYCGILDDGALKCRTAYAKGKAENLAKSGNGKYVSRVSCDNSMKMTDCDNEMKVEINHCDAQAVQDDHGANYGGFIEKRMCVAVGDTEDIVAIATCCTVE